MPQSGKSLVPEYICCQQIIYNMQPKADVTCNNAEVWYPTRFSCLNIGFWIYAEILTEACDLTLLRALYIIACGIAINVLFPNGVREFLCCKLAHNGQNKVFNQILCNLLLLLLDIIMCIPGVNTLSAKNMEYFFISAIFCTFLECAGCFCIWNTFLRADITF